MTQANDLGAIANQPGAFFRARNNNAQQAIVTQHYGATEPPILYPNMMWFSAGDGYIKIRNPTNTAWQNIGTIGPPLKWTTSVDLPQEQFTVGDIKESYNFSQPTGWLLLNDGSIGDGSSGANGRANPDCWPLFNLLWYIVSDDWCSLFYAGTFTRSGKGVNSLADWNNHRHMRLPQSLGRTTSCAGSGYGLTTRWVATWDGVESVSLSTDNMAPHYHLSGSHAHWRPDHGHPYAVDTSSQQSWGSQGEGAFPTGTGSATGAYAGWPAGTDATVIGGGGGGWSSDSGAVPTSWVGASAPVHIVQPTTYVYRYIKL